MKRQFLLLTFLCAASAAFAQEQGFYLGFGGGRSQFDDTIARQVRGAFDRFNQQTGGQPFYQFETGRLTQSSDTAQKLFGGYQFLPWLGLELGWQDFGVAKATASFIGIEPSFGSDERLSAEIKGTNLNVVLSQSLDDNWYGQLRAGVIRAETDYQSVALEPSVVIAGVSERELAGTIGLSLGFRATQQWGLRLDWDRVLGVGGAYGDDRYPEFAIDNIDVLSLNAIYSFGQ